MDSQALNVQLGRLSGQQDMILRELQDAKEGRKVQYSSIEQIKGSVLTLDGRIRAVEDSLTKFTPTIEEFITIKHRVIGAGSLGRWLWILGGLLITAVYRFHEEVLKWSVK